MNRFVLCRKCDGTGKSGIVNIGHEKAPVLMSRGNFENLKELGMKLNGEILKCEECNGKGCIQNEELK